MYRCWYIITEAKANQNAICHSLCVRRNWFSSKGPFLARKIFACEFSDLLFSANLFYFFGFVLFYFSTAFFAALQYVYYSSFFFGADSKRKHINVCCWFCVLIYLFRQEINHIVHINVCHFLFIPSLALYRSVQMYFWYESNVSVNGKWLGHFKWHTHTLYTMRIHRFIASYHTKCFNANRQFHLNNIKLRYKYYRSYSFAFNPQ